MNKKRLWVFPALALILGSCGRPAPSLTPSKGVVAPVTPAEPTTTVTAPPAAQHPTETPLYRVPEKTVDGWETASLDSVNVDADEITRLMRSILNNDFAGLHSLLVVKDHKLVLEAYTRPYNRIKRHDVASVTKSVTSVLIGIAIDRGVIAGKEQRLIDLLPEYADQIDSDPEKRKLRLWHILTMTSGIEWDEETYAFGDPRNDCEKMKSSSDGPKFVLERPIISPPGTRFQYSCANSMLLSAIIKHNTGLNTDEFAEPYLFGPLGISDYEWEHYADGLTDTDGGLYLRPRDMAKIGELMLRAGEWNGRQIVSPAWIDESTKGHVFANYGVEYGYQWWRRDVYGHGQISEIFLASGTGGQQIMVLPALDLVVVFTSELENHDENVQRNHLILTEYILPAVRRKQ